MEEQIKELERRVLFLESQNKKFMTAITDAARMILSNPMAKAMIPTEMKQNLEAYIQQQSPSVPS
jgi:hypothetical protein